MPDSRFEMRNVSVSVGLASDREALFVMRYAELTTDYYVKRGGKDPYVSVEAGRVVRLPEGWRLLQRLNMSDRTGLGEAAMSASQTDWECR
jgi:hypothetical protein